MLLKDKVVIVTGAAGGIGLAIASAMAAEGAAVVMCDLQREKVEQAARAVSKSGKAVALRTDVTHKAEVEQMVRTVLEQFGRIDILVNNAGIWRGAPIVEVTEEDWDAVIAVNLKGPFLCSQAVARHMIQQRSGKIIHISSAAAGGAPRWGAYSPSKAAINALTKVMAAELLPYGITVSAVAPGATDTAMTELIERTLPGSRFPHAQKPEAVAQVVLHLASAEGGSISGQIVPVP